MSANFGIFKTNYIILFTIIIILLFNYSIILFIYFKFQ